METLTDRQQDILTFIRDYRDRYGYAPSYKEIGDAVGLESKSSVWWQVRALAAKGRLRVNPGMPRAIVVVDQAVTR